MSTHTDKPRLRLPTGVTDTVVGRVWPKPNRYEDDPVGWVRHNGGFLWSAQREVADSVATCRFTAVQSAHGTGKSFLAGQLAAWWIDAHPVGEAFVVTSAPTDKQVKAILWREIGRAHRKSGLDGRINLDAEWYIGPELVAYGRKPADYNDPERAAAAFQGIHAKFVLVILDEACGIPPWLWTATESLVTNEHSRVLAIGNPDDPSTEFATVCGPASEYEHFTISAFDLPAYTGEEVPEYLHDLLTGRTWVDERRRKWGERSPLYVSKVLGEFPEVTEDTLITPAWIRQAQERDLSPRAIDDFGNLGVDVASTGTDMSAIYLDRGGHVREVWCGNEPDTMRFTGIVANIIAEDWQDIGAVVDVIGVGTGVVDRLKEQELPVTPFNAAERAYEPVKFKNRRAEAYWALREDFENGDIDIEPEDLDLAAELGSIKWWVDSQGRIVVEPKDEQRKRLGRSPDRADAVMMCRQRGAAMQSVLPPTPTITGDLLGKEF